MHICCCEWWCFVAPESVGLYGALLAVMLLLCDVGVMTSTLHNYGSLAASRPLWLCRSRWLGASLSAHTTYYASGPAAAFENLGARMGRLGRPTSGPGAFIPVGMTSVDRRLG